LHGFTTASDPVVRAGTNGLFYYAGIAFNRGTSNGVVFVARFMDLNNKENGNVAEDSFPIRYMNTVIVAHGSNTQFLDKPWIAVDIPRSGQSCNLSIPQGNGHVMQTIPAGNVYLAYANITTTNGVVTSTIYFSRSTDCGNTWSTPIALSYGYALSQGTTIQIDPQTGIVYVTWRAFHSGTKQPNDAIAVAVSLDGGHNFTPGFPVVTLPAFNPNTPNAPAFFEQGTTSTSFRSAAYPAMAVADSGIPWLPGPVYFAWSQRGVGLSGAARIMMLAIPGNGMITPNGIILPTPFPVDNLPITDDSGQTFGRGHQWGPSMTFIEGKLMLVYYDQRLDHTAGSLQPILDPSGTFVNDPQGRFYLESRELKGELAPPTGKFDAVFNTYIDDANPPLDLRRHTIDVTLAQSDGGLGIPTFTYTRVSRYDFGLLFDEKDTKFRQLKVNPPGLPMFQKGTVPFMGDYIDIVGQMFVPKASGGWAFNNPGVNASSPVHYAAWTSNQDVIPPIDGDWTKYFPITSGKSVFDGTNTPACRPGTGYEGDRNQNVYQSRITQGLLVSSPQNSKPLSTTIQRAFVVLVQNFTNFQKNFRLTIANQPPGSFAIAGQTTAGGYASFQQALPNQPKLPNPLPALVKTQDVTIAGHSGAARTLFALSSSPTASIMVNVNEIDQNGNVLSGGLSGFILLNADGTVPTLTNPDSAPINTNITGVEVYAPGITGPGITGSNVNAMTITSPGITGPGITGSTCAPGITGPGITGPGITGTGCVAPGITGPGITGPGITGPGITGSTVVSPGITGPGITGPGITGSAVSDATYSVGSGANTNTGLTVKLTGCDISPCKDTPLQLIVSQIYTTPNTDGQCNLISVQQDITLSNVLHPTFTPVSNPGITGTAASDAVFSLAPGDTALITLRGHTDIATMQRIVTQTTPVIVAPVDTSSFATSPTFFAPLFITTATLPDGVVGKFYGASMDAIGGTTPYQSWSLSEVGGTLPPSLNLTLDSETGRGLISGFPTSAGTFIFTVQVTDAANPTRNTATKQFSIRVAAPLAITTASLSPGVQNINYNTKLLSTGGTAPTNWNVVGLPAGLNFTSDGTINGAAAVPGIFNLQVTVTDSASPAQTTAIPLTLTIFSNTGNIAFVQHPTGSIPGQVISPAVTVKVTDAAGAILPGVAVTVALGNNPSGGILSGTTTKLSGEGGVATFSDLRVDKPGTGYTLIASAPGAGGTSSNSFSVAVPVFFGQVVDPVGDAGGGTNPDLVFASITTFSDNTAKLSVRFAAGTFSSSTTQAEFSLDTDQNVATGRPGIDGGCSAPDSGLIGTDYVITLGSGFANNTGSIFKVTSHDCSALTLVGTAPVAIFNDGMNITVPLSMLTNTAGPGVSGPATTGPWKFKVSTYFKLDGPGFSAITDRMPDTGVVPGSTASAPLPVTPAPSGMLAWWPADGYPTEIQVGHGMLISNGVSYVPSEVGQSFAFDGLAGFITITDDGDLRPAAVTVDFWFKSNVTLPDPNHPEIPFVFKLNPGDDANAASKGYDFFYQFGAIGFGLPSTPNGTRSIVYSSDGSTGIMTGTWHHVAGTYDQTTGQKLYLDGVLVGSRLPFGPIQYQPAALQFGTVFNTANFTPGVNSQNRTYFFNGQLDEIEIHNRVLSASEIQAIFNAGSAGKAKP